ncbi:MAG: phosphatidate cytidylyltransferase [Saprospiraceae bacterium]|jgi:phosphatidate cytidylyltransferase
MKGLLQRAITAVIFVVVMLLGLYSHHYIFVALFAIITAGCLWEFFLMVMDRESRRDFIRLFIGVAFGLTPFVLASVMQLGWVDITEEFIIVSAGLFFPFIFLAFIYELFSKSERPFMNVAYIVLGMVYIGAPFALLDFIAFDGDKFYADTVLGLLLLSWANDTGAYLIGSKIGKTKLIPRISPNKTWEGSIGGVCVTFLAAWALCYLFQEDSKINWFVLGVIVSVFGSIGDLIESMLKRTAGVKDSGRLMPGHGGLLDRFDAFIFLLPFAAAYILWIRLAG